VFLLGYVILPGSVSALLCLLLVRYMPQNRKQFLVLLSLALLALGSIWIVRIGLAARQTLLNNGRELDDLVGQFDLIRSSLARATG